MNPHIFYWKWCEEDFDTNTMRERTMDIIENTEFDLIYIAFHGMKDSNLLKISDEDMKIFEECVDIFHKHGRKVFLDISRFYEMKIGDEEMLGIQGYKGKLDENGDLICHSDDFTQMLKCWVVDMIDGKTFKNKTEFTGTAIIEDGKIKIRAGE